MSSPERSAMSQALQYSTDSIGTVANITKHAKGLSKLIHDPGLVIATKDETVEDPF